MLCKIKKINLHQNKSLKFTMLRLYKAEDCQAKDHENFNLHN